MVSLKKFFLNWKGLQTDFSLALFLGLFCVLAGATAMGAWRWDLSIPWLYSAKGGDEIWQLILTKMVVDNGWVLTNPFLGAPGVSHWHNNAAAQTSSMHSVLMLGLSKIIGNPVTVQQSYFLLNFGLIAISAYAASRLVGLSRITAACVCVMYSLLCYRFNFYIYSYLANYFCIPMACVPVYWIVTGKYAESPDAASMSLRQRAAVLFKGKKFIIGLLAVVITALSDGYYAFFTLLLLGVATGIRLFTADFRRPLNFAVPAALIGVLLATALLMMSPISHYKKKNPEEFAPNGVKDTSLLKSPAEAEVYTTSLKLMLAPSASHRVPMLASSGQKLLQSSELARRFPVGPAVAPLGILGGLLFFVSLIVLVVPRSAEANWVANKPPLWQSILRDPVVQASCGLGLFVYLCSTWGGLGTLIALVYPTIRAYDRFGLFLLFFLYVGAGAAMTFVLAMLTGKRHFIVLGAMIVVALLSVLDQVPANTGVRDASIRPRFLAERNFVSKLESDLPKGAMVYQFPHSQWLYNSPHYGWGGLGHIRLYLHSTNLRWSNGAAKNSVVDEWHARIARLPLKLLLQEVRAAGFAGVVVDRHVLSNDEFTAVKKELAKVSAAELTEDDDSQLVFAPLKDPGFRVLYDNSYKVPIRISVSNRETALAGPYPKLINASAFTNYLSTRVSSKSLTIEGPELAQIALDPTVASSGLGETPIQPLEAVQGELSCSWKTADENATSELVLDIKNNSAFGWLFNRGKFPFRIGMHVLSQSGKMQHWDNGARLPIESAVQASKPSLAAWLGAGESTRFVVPSSALRLDSLVSRESGAMLNFQLLQDGHAWFPGPTCQIPYPPQTPVTALTPSRP